MEAFAELRGGWVRIGGAQDGFQLLALLQLDDTLSVLLDKLANYAQRRSDEDTRSSIWTCCEVRQRPRT